jgi:hypothetical protein
MAATMAVAAPSGAATEKVYESETKAECILAPGVLNEPGTISVKLRGEGPATTATGESFALKNSTITVTTPAKWGENLFGIGARQARGNVLVTELESEQATPSPLNIAKPPEFEMGLPFKTPVRNEAVTFTVPTEGHTFVTGPVTVTAESGNFVWNYDPVPGFKQTGEHSFESTHRGVQAEFNGFSEPEPGRFEKIVGPLEGSCTEPKGGVLVTVPITATTTSTSQATTTTSSAPTTTTSTGAPPTTTTTTTTTTTSCTSHCGIHVVLNDKLAGFLKIHKLGNQQITLPEGCTFKGEGEIPGEFEANTTCPPFSGSFKILGLPASIGTELVEAGPVKGTITPQTNGKLLIQGTAKDNIKIDSLGLLGLNLPVSCETAEPVLFPLKAEATAGELLSVGAASNGETTLPAVRCNGFLGGVVGSLLTLLMSGPNNPYQFDIHP